MLQKQIKNAATISWCPHEHGKTILAAGTVEGMLDANFQSSSRLALYDASLAQPGREMPLLGSVTSKMEFKKLCWGTKGINEGTYGRGLLAGGMNDGSLSLFDADAILQQKSPQECLISSTTQHHGSVLSLDFHRSEPNLLVSGGANGEVYCWDIKDPSRPVASRPGDAQIPANVNAVQWNQQVPSVLATSLSNGQTAVWDLRHKRVVLSFRESSHSNSPATAVAWNPTQALKVVVSYANSNCEIWDLRNALKPRATLTNVHHGNVLCVDFNPQDPEMLMTSGEDGICALWSASGDLLHSVETNEPNFDLHWSPHTPSVFATATFSGKVSVRSMPYCGPKHAPSWLRRPVGSSFAFGGRFVDFKHTLPPAAPDRRTSTNSQTGAETAKPTGPPKHEISMNVLNPDYHLIEKTNAFRNAVMLRQDHDLRGYCDEKVASCVDDNEKTAWKFMRILFEDDRHRKFVRELGFDPAELEVEDDDPSTAQSADGEPGQQQPNDELPPEQEEWSPDGGDFFDRVASRGDLSALVNEQKDVEPKISDVLPPAKDDDADNFEPEDDVDVAVKNALVVGDFAKAVSLSFDAGRFADALVIASCKTELWVKTQKRYFAQHKNRFFKKVVSKVITNDLSGYVDSVNLSDWRQALAIIVTYSSPQQPLEPLCSTLGDRLFAERRDGNAALLCFICSRNVNKMVDVLLAAHPEADHLLRLHFAIEKGFIFSQVAQSSGGSEKLAEAYSNYAELLASQGQLPQALDFLQLVSQAALQAGAQPSPQVQVLMDRLFQANADQLVNVAPPRFPYQRVDLPNLCDPYAQTGRQPGQQQPGGNRRRNTVGPQHGQRSGVHGHGRMPSGRGGTPIRNARPQVPRGSNGAGGPVGMPPNMGRGGPGPVQQQPGNPRIAGARSAVIPSRPMPSRGGGVGGPGANPNQRPMPNQLPSNPNTRPMPVRGGTMPRPRPGGPVAQQRPMPSGPGLRPMPGGPGQRPMPGGPGTGGFPSNVGAPGGNMPPGPGNNMPPPRGNVNMPPPRGNPNMPAPGGNANMPPPRGNSNMPPAGNPNMLPPRGNPNMPLAGNTNMLPPRGNPNMPAPGGNVNMPPPRGNVNMPPPRGNVNMPPPGGNMNMPPAGGHANMPPPGGNVNMPPPGGNAPQPRHMANPSAGPGAGGLPPPRGINRPGPGNARPVGGLPPSRPMPGGPQPRQMPPTNNMPPSTVGGNPSLPPGVGGGANMPPARPGVMPVQSLPSPASGAGSATGPSPLRPGLRGAAGGTPSPISQRSGSVSSNTSSNAGSAIGSVGGVAPRGVAQPRRTLPRGARGPGGVGTPRLAAARRQSSGSATVADVDMSNASQEGQFVAGSLKKVLNDLDTVPNIRGFNKKRLNDMRRKMNFLYEKLAANAVDAKLMQSLTSLSQSLSARNYDDATKIQLDIMTFAWSSNSNWLTPLKQLIKLAKQEFPPGA